MGEKHFDTARIRAVAREFELAAALVDESGASMPETLDAGPLTPLLIEMVHEVVADAADLVIRLDAAGDALREVARRNEDTENDNVHTLAEFLRDLSGDSPGAGG